MNILSLDLATITGWAANIHGRRSGVIEFQLKRGESPGMWFLRCRARLNELHSLLGGDIAMIVYELRRTTGAGLLRLVVWVS